MNKIELRNITKAYEKSPPVIENLDLNIKDGSFTILLGPSGCGKSTILRMIAGLESETSGEIIIDGQSMRGIPPGERNIAMVFQNYALYPTMTVRDNIDFGLKNAKIPKAERDRRIDEISEMVGLAEYLSRKPQQLSGGQRQRVALARAIVKKPAVFLMDEPLSNLDAQLRSQIRTDLITLYQQLKTTFVYVTHDQVEAMSMGSDIILFNKGQIQQHDSPAQLYQSPNNVFTARFIGSPPMNVLPIEHLLPQLPQIPNAIRYVGFRPEKAKLIGKKVEEKDTHIYLLGQLLTREMLGSETLYVVNTPLGHVHIKEFEDYIPDVSGKVKIAIKRSNLMYFDYNEQVVSL